MHEADGDLLAREAHQVAEGRNYFCLVQVRTQLGGGAGVGERLELLGFDERPVQVEDERADHAGTSP